MVWITYKFIVASQELSIVSLTIVTSTRISGIIIKLVHTNYKALRHYTYCPKMADWIASSSHVSNH